MTFSFSKTSSSAAQCCGVSDHHIDVYMGSNWQKRLAAHFSDAPSNTLSGPPTGIPNMPLSCCRLDEWGRPIDRDQCQFSTLEITRNQFIHAKVGLFNYIFQYVYY
ncbi:unnamed protein product [Protopolystoma xenopodis]|uniref:Uncharacterized protein n=1 Tax=Protopolystoma xenopodis TaxID=117903 RepID=A0A448WSG2_9PLAT|nr:unnamed protein product [Protopolystoma xenopodis]